MEGGHAINDSMRILGGCLHTVIENGYGLALPFLEFKSTLELRVTPVFTPFRCLYYVHTYIATNFSSEGPSFIWYWNAIKLCNYVLA